VERLVKYDCQNIQVRYKVEVTNRFHCTEIEKRLSEQLWGDISTWVRQTAKECLPEVRRVKKTPWLSKDTLQIKMI